MQPLTPNAVPSLVMVDPIRGKNLPSPPAPTPSEPRPARSDAGDTRHLHLVRAPSPRLPAPLTGFVGRRREITEATRLLQRSRLLTLTGPGGSGKTRLAIETARRAAESFPDEVEWVELASLNDPALVPQAVATALNVRGQPGRGFAEAVAAHLQFRRLLLVLDNCEHLVAAAAAFADHLLHACPGLRILATSREALGIAGEATWPVPPLSLPAPGAGMEAQGRTEAVQLFVERARAVLPTFELTAQNAEAVARICERMDGIPLAIELAAARARLLSPAQIASRLDDCFRLLTLGHRAAVPRQQTLRATMDWSYALLTEPERTLFARLAVFAGGFTLESAETVCAGEGVPPGEVLDLLTHLVDKSLVAVGPQPDQARCRLLETVRQYAAERLEREPDAEAVEWRHARHFLDLAEAAEPELLGAGQTSAMDRLQAEHDNLRAALRWLLARGEATLAARLGGALSRFWHTRGYMSEGRQWLEEVLACPAPGPEAGTAGWKAARAKALKGAGVLAWGQGDYHRSTEQFEAALGLVRDLGDTEGVASLYNNVGVIALHQADYARAAELFEASLALRREQGHEWGIATALNNLGATAGKQGDLPRARAYYEESLALQRAMGNTQGTALCLSNLGAVAYGQGEYAQAFAFFEEGLVLRQQLGDRTGVADSLGKLGKVAQRQGDVPRARRFYAESLALLRELSDKERIAGGLMGIAGLVLAQGHALQAVRLLSAADAVREAIGAPLTSDERTDHERDMAAAREALAPAAFGSAWTEGRMMPLDRVLDLAAEELNAPAPDAAARPDAAPAPPAAGVHPMPELRIFALGPLEVRRGERTVSPAEWGSAKPRELLLYLLCHPAGRTKEQIGLALWPEASPAQLRNSFHVTLHHLRRALGRAEWIVFATDRYQFDRSLPYDFDVEAFEAALARAERLRQEPDTPRGEVIRSLEEALRWYRGDFLEETLFGDWHVARQDELRRRRLDALLSLAELRFAEGRYAEAADAHRQALAHDRLFERAHRGLMRSLARLGERERALAHYPIVEALLRDELHTAPDAETTALYERIRRGEQP